MKAVVCSALLLWVFPSTAGESGAQTPVGALTIDERQGGQWGWAVDYETAAAARQRALRECGAGCSVVLTFGRCAAYAADQDDDSRAVGWAEAYASAADARRRALAECRSRGGGSGCIVRAWGCNGPVVEEGLNLDRATRRQIQEGLAADGYDPGGADGLFGPRTRAAIRAWQSSRGRRATGYLDGAAAAALRTADGSEPAVAAAAPSASPAVPAPQPPSSTAPAATAELEGLFWQSIMNSTNPAEFEAYLEQFPDGVFRALAQARLEALRSGTAEPPAAAGAPAGGAGSPVSGGGASGTAAGVAAVGDPRRRSGEVFRDCDVCPQMVVMRGGTLALGRYEVTVGEYRAFAAATGGGAGGGCSGADGGSWRDPDFSLGQTDRHPVTCVSWNDAQEYVAWLTQTAGVRYRLPTESEWERAAAGSLPGCDLGRDRNAGTCPVGSYRPNRRGLSDMVGNVIEWTEDCSEGDCGRRVLRGGDWMMYPEVSSFARRRGNPVDLRNILNGFRVARTLD